MALRITTPSATVVSTMLFILAFSWLAGLMLDDMGIDPLGIDEPDVAGAADGIYKAIGDGDFAGFIFGAIGLVLQLLYGIIYTLLWYPAMYLFIVRHGVPHGLGGLAYVLIAPIIAVMGWILIAFLRGFRP